MSSGETIMVAPKSVQEEMGVMSSGWVYAAKNNNLTGIVPRNYLQPPNINKRQNNSEPINSNQSNLSQVPENDITTNIENTENT